MCEVVKESKIYCVDEDGAKFLELSSDGDTIKVVFFDKEAYLTTEMFDAMLSALDTFAGDYA